VVRWYRNTRNSHQKYERLSFPLNEETSTAESSSENSDQDENVDEQSDVIDEEDVNGSKNTRAGKAMDIVVQAYAEIQLNDPELKS